MVRFVPARSKRRMFRHCLAALAIIRILRWLRHCENVPQLCGNTYNEARRFVTLIDALYEARTRLVASSDVIMENLFLGFDAQLVTADGDEEIALGEQAIQQPN